MPINYIIEMVCDWWAFSWQKENLCEIFNWYDQHEKYIKLSDKTRKTVEDILEKICSKLDDMTEIEHSGTKGMQWGVRNGPPYPIQDKRKTTDTEIQKTSLKTASGKDIIVVDHVELKGVPNSITQITRKNGGIDRNFYGANGWQTKQISNHDHGQPKRHQYGEHGEHVHDYIYDENGNLSGRPIRNLTDEERKENGDFL